MTLDRLHPKRNGSGWSIHGALLTVLHAMVTWGLYSLIEAELLSEPTLMVIVTIAVPIATYVLARSAEVQDHCRNQRRAAVQKERKCERDTTR